MYASRSRGGLFLKTLAFLAVVSFTPAIGSTDQATTEPEAKVIHLDPGADEYVRVLGGPPETVTMRSGQVVLVPGESIGKHNTEAYEELLVVFEGEGVMQITDGPTLSLKGGSVAYCPPRTEHDVVNTGAGRMRYLYVVAIAE
jgi:quercetin dioxygenase-like cupin family protein